MISRQKFCRPAAVLAGAAAVSGRAQAASIPEAATSTAATMQPPLSPTERAGLSAGGDAERLDVAVAHEGRAGRSSISSPSRWCARWRPA